MPNAKSKSWVASTAIATIIAVATLGSGHRTAANPLPMVPQTGPISVGGYFYYSLGGVGGVYRAPTFNAFQSVSIPGLAKIDDVISKRQNLLGGGPAVTIGVVLPWDNLIGRRARIEISGSGFFGSARSSVGSASQNTALFAVDGSVVAIFPAIADPFKGGRLKTSVAQGSAILRFKTDFALGRSVTLTPQIGVLGGAGVTRQRFDYSLDFLFASGFELPGFIKQTVHARHFGGQVGADISWKTSRAFTLHGGFTIAVLHVRGRLEANDCATALIVANGSQCTGTLYRTSVSDIASKLAVRLGGSLGGTWSWGWGKATLMGYFNWTSAVPGVRNYAPDRIGVAVSPSRIAFQSSYSYGGFLMVSFPLN